MAEGRNPRTPWRRARAAPNVSTRQFGTTSCRRGNPAGASASSATVPGGDEHAEHAADRCQHQVFDEQQARGRHRDAPTASRMAIYGDAGEAPHGLQVRDVDARDDEQEADRAAQDVQRSPHARRTTSSLRSGIERDAQPSLKAGYSRRGDRPARSSPCSPGRAASRRWPAGPGHGDHVPLGWREARSIFNGTQRSVSGTPKPGRRSRRLDWQRRPR